MSQAKIQFPPGTVLTNVAMRNIDCSGGSPDASSAIINLGNNLGMPFTNYWVSNVEGTWDSTSNWSQARMPVLTDDVYFTPDHTGKCTIPSVSDPPYVEDFFCATLNIETGFPSSSFYSNCRRLKIYPTGSVNAVSIPAWFVINAFPSGSMEWQIWATNLIESSIIGVTQVIFADNPHHDIQLTLLSDGATTNNKFVLSGISGGGLGFVPNYSGNIQIDYLDTGILDTGVRGVNFQESAGEDLVLNMNCSEIHTCQFIITGKMEFHAPNLTKIKIYNNDTDNNGYGAFLWFGDVFDTGQGTALYDINKINVQYEMLYPDSAGLGYIYTNLDFMNNLIFNTTVNPVYYQNDVSPHVKIHGNINYISGSLVDFISFTETPPTIECYNPSTGIILESNASFNVRSMTGNQHIKVRDNGHTLTIPIYVLGDWDGSLWYPDTASFNISAFGDTTVNDFKIYNCNNTGFTVTGLSSLDFSGNTGFMDFTHGYAWIAPTNGVWTNATNWSWNHVPTTGEDAFVGFGMGDCSVNTSPNLSSFYVSHAYDGTFRPGNSTITVTPIENRHLEFKSGSDRSCQFNNLVVASSTGDVTALGANMNVGGNFTWNSETVTWDSSSDRFAVSGVDSTITLNGEFNVPNLITNTVNQKVTWETGANVMRLDGTGEIGNAHGMVEWKSNGTPYHINMVPAGQIIGGLKVADCTNIGSLIKMTKATSVDGGDNTGFVFVNSNSFSDSTVSDGASVMSTIDRRVLVSLIQQFGADPYFDSTSKIKQVYVFYTSDDARQSQYSIFEGYPLTGHFLWDAGAKDGTWSKTKVVVFDANNAKVTLSLSQEQLMHSDGTMNLII